MNISVVKRDGKKEPFNYDKLVTSIAKAGVPIAESEKVSRTVEAWIMQNANTGEIKSTQIRDIITEKLMTDFPMEAANYKVFKKG